MIINFIREWFPTINLPPINILECYLNHLPIDITDWWKLHTIDVFDWSKWWPILAVSLCIPRYRKNPPPPGPHLKTFERNSKKKILAWEDFYGNQEMQGIWLWSFPQNYLQSERLDINTTGMGGGREEEAGPTRKHISLDVLCFVCPEYKSEDAWKGRTVTKTNEC
jgi:hypothetical protein